MAQRADSRGTPSEDQKKAARGLDQKGVQSAWDNFNRAVEAYNQNPSVENANAMSQALILLQETASNGQNDGGRSYASTIAPAAQNEYDQAVAKNGDRPANTVPSGGSMANETGGATMIQPMGSNPQGIGVQSGMPGSMPGGTPTGPIGQPMGGPTSAVTANDVLAKWGGSSLPIGGPSGGAMGQAASPGGLALSGPPQPNVAGSGNPEALPNGGGVRRGTPGGNQVGWQYGSPAPAPQGTPAPTTPGGNTIPSNTTINQYGDSPIGGGPRNGQIPVDQYLGLGNDTAYQSADLSTDPTSWWAQAGINPTNEYDTFSPYSQGGLGNVLNAYERQNNLPAYWSDQIGPLVQQQIMSSYMTDNPLNTPSEILNAIPGMVTQLQTPGTYYNPSGSWSEFVNNGASMLDPQTSGKSAFSALKPADQIASAQTMWQTLAGQSVDPMYMQNVQYQIQQLGDQFVQDQASGKIPSSMNFLDYLAMYGADQWL